MEKSQVLSLIGGCFLLSFFVPYWFDSFILTLVVCGLQITTSVWLVTLFNYKWGVTENLQFLLCFGFGVGCQVLGVFMLLFVNGFSLFSTFYTLGTMFTLGSLLLLMEHSVHVKVNEIIEAKVKTFVKDASAQVKRLSEQLENVCNQYLAESTLKTYAEWYNSDIGGLVQCLCALVFPQLGVLLLTLTAVLDAGAGTRARFGAVVLGAAGGMAVPVLFGLMGLQGLGFCFLGGLAALTFEGFGGLGTRFFGGLDGIMFLALEVLAGLVALSMGGLSGLFTLAIGSLGALAVLIMEQEEHGGEGDKRKLVPSVKNHPREAVMMGAMGGLVALALGGLDVLGSLTMGGLSGLAGQALGALGERRILSGQKKPVSSTNGPNNGEVNVHDKRPKDGGRWKKTLNTLEAKLKHKLMKVLQYLILATVLWYWGTALILLILNVLIWTVFYILCLCSKSTSTTVCFVFGAACTMMGVYVRFLPGFSLLLFTVLFTVGNVFILESTLLLKDSAEQQKTLPDNTRRVITSVILSCYMLTLLALFWWQSIWMSLTFCVMHILSRYSLTFRTMEGKGMSFLVSD